MKLNFKILILFFAVLQSVFSNAQIFGEYNINKQLQLSDLKLKGNVKSLHIYTRDYFTEDEKDRDYFWQQEDIYQFNKNGKIVETAIKIHEKPYAKQIYNYNKKGKITTVEYWSYDKKEWFTHTSSIKYNKDNLVIELNKPQNDYTTRFIYDENNNIIEERNVSIEKKFDRLYRKYTYDKRNNLIQVNRYYFDFIEKKELVLGSQIMLKYDSKNNVIEKKHFRGDYKDLLQKITHSYNDKKQVTERKSYDTQQPDDVVLKNVYTYNKYGDVILNKEYLHLRDTTKLEIKTYKIEYDKHKNWIKKSIYTNDKLMELFKREITYYN